MANQYLSAATDRDWPASTDSQTPEMSPAGTTDLRSGTPARLGSCPPDQVNHAAEFETDVRAPQTFASDMWTHVPCDQREQLHVNAS